MGQGDYSRRVTMIVNSNASQILLFADFVVDLVQTCLVKWTSIYAHNHKPIWPHGGALLLTEGQVETGLIVTKSM